MSARRALAQDVNDLRAEIDDIAEKKGAITRDDINKLRNKYADDAAIVKDILEKNGEVFKNKRNYFKKVAKRVHDRYADSGRRVPEILDLMYHHKDANNWSDQDFEAFEKAFLSLLAGRRLSEIDVAPYSSFRKSKIGRLLGDPNAYTQIEIEGLHIGKGDQPILDDILNLYAKTAPLHRNIVIQSLTYEDCSQVALSGTFDRNRNDASVFTHPVIVAMFIPKFKYFETHMLQSNFGAIVKARYERKPIHTAPDFLLLQAIGTDPAGMICDSKNPLKDIKKRQEVQVALWKAVNELRGGFYYASDTTQALTEAMSGCHSNFYDNGDLAYRQDEGAFMRQLMHIFGLRPIVVATKPLANIFSYGLPWGHLQPQQAATLSFKLQGGALPAGVSVNMGTGFGGLNDQFIEAPESTLTSVPMIVLQIPQFREGGQPIDLREATSQTLWLSDEGKTMMPKEQQIIHTKEVLIFYVDRRERVPTKTYMNQLRFSQLPMTFSGLERLNTYPLSVPSNLTLPNTTDNYALRSVVAITSTQVPNNINPTGTSNLITGAVTLIMSHRNFEQGVFAPQYYIYDPYGASIPVQHPNDVKGYMNNKPISIIQSVITKTDPNTKRVTPSFFDMASRQGTLFIYAKPFSFDNTETIAFV
jgi:hypothetical protein